MKSVQELRRASRVLAEVVPERKRNRATTEQAALVRAAKSMGRSLETGEILETLCDEVRRALRCEKVSVALGDEVDGYAVVGDAGMPDGWRGFRQPPGWGLGGRAVRKGRLLITHAYGEEGYSPPETSALSDLRTCIAVPLRWDDRVRGFFLAGFTRSRPVAPADEELLEGFAELAGLACANAERHSALRESAELDGLTGCMNRDALQRRLAELVARADREGQELALALLDLDGFKAINDVFGHPSGDGVLKSVGAALRSGVRAGDLVARYGGDEFAVILPGASEQRARPVLDRARAAIRSLEVPGGALTACVGLTQHVHGEPLEELVSRADDALRRAKGSPGAGLMHRASRPLATAISPTAAGGRARRQRWRAASGDIGLQLARQPDSGAGAAVAAAELRDLLDLESCSVLRLLGEGRLELLAASGASDLEGTHDLNGEAGPLGRALREKRPVLRAGREGAVPVLIGGRAWGAIRCAAGERHLDEVDLDLISAVSEHLSASIRASELYEQLTRSMIASAEALAAALEAKDTYTTDHARSIAEVAVEVGRELGLPESAIDDLRYGGIFHDVGKIAIPDELINKPGPLTDEEFEVIKLHPVTGAEILSPVPFLYGVRTIVRHAHEHWDGSGYPDGLRGTEIPLGARIVLAVDAYHAMTSDRPYRGQLSADRALEELDRGAGSQFDPDVVETLLRVLRRRDVAVAA